MSGATNRATASAPGGPREAIVSAVLGPRSVRIDAPGLPPEATLAVAGSYAPAVGDAVLVLGDGPVWVIGVVRSLRAVDGALRASDGVHASLSEDGDRLLVRDSAGAVLFVHDARTGRSTVETRGDLSLHAPRGDLELVASGAVRVAAERVELHGEETVRLTRGGDAAVALDPRGAHVSAPALDVTAARGRISLKDAVFASERLETAVTKARHLVGVVEVRAERILEQAKNVYREVEELSQLKAARVRTVATGTFSVLSKRATVKAEDDLALMGDKIHLA